jgi:hypothetical protein
LQKREGVMGIFSLFELFLIMFAFYAILKYEGGMRILVPILCLIAVFLFERLQGRLKEDEEAKKRLLMYKLEDHRKETIQGKS